MPEKSKEMCVGCRDDWYNHNRGDGCWSYGNAKVVRRYKIGWWVQPDSVSAFTEVETLDCHNAYGHYALFEKLPPHLVQLKRAK
jgi:hypothetical protein